MRMMLLQRLHTRLKGRLASPASQAVAAPMLTPGTATSDTIDLSDPAVARDPFVFYEALRPAGPVQWLPRNGAWIVLGHGAVKEAFARPEHFSNAPYRDVDPVLLGEDPPRQALIRRLVSRHFTSDAMERLEATGARAAAASLQSEMDAVGGFSLPVSRAVAAELIGFDRATVEELVAATDAAAAGPDPLTGLVSTLHGFAPRAAVFRQLLKDGEGMIGEAEAHRLVALLWLASTTTTERVIARGVLRLVQHPEVREAVAADPALLSIFIEEVMRLHPPEHLVPRLTTRETQLAGVTIPGGAVVHLCLGAANRDPEHYPDAASLRLDRSYRRHFAFGGGIHHCVGAALARRVVAASLSALLRRSAQPRLLGSEGDIAWFASMTALSPFRLDIAL
jgi:cytochrome P450